MEPVPMLPIHSGRPRAAWTPPTTGPDRAPRCAAMACQYARSRPNESLMAHRLLGGVGGERFSALPFCIFLRSPRKKTLLASPRSGWFSESPVRVNAFFQPELSNKARNTLGLFSPPPFCSWESLASPLAFSNRLSDQSLPSHGPCSVFGFRCSVFVLLSRFHFDIADGLAMSNPCGQKFKNCFALLNISLRHTRRSEIWKLGNFCGFESRCFGHPFCLSEPGRHTRPMRTKAHSRHEAL